MLLVAAHEQLCNKFINDNRESGFRCVERDSFLKIPGKVRKVSVVLFGVFRVEEITMALVVEDAAETFLIANPVSRVQVMGR
jgi:hypothetical protein